MSGADRARGELFYPKSNPNGRRTVASSGSAVNDELAETTNRRLDRLAAGLAKCEECFHTSIEALIDPFVLLRPLRDDASGIVDFVYEYANDAACEANALARE